MKVKIKSTGYKDEGFPKILKYLNQINSKQVIINLDKIDLDGFDLVFDNLKISNLNVDVHKDEHYCISTFSCSKPVFKNLLKLIRSLKKLGDGGHTFSVQINNKSFSWDGDGSDRVEEINDIDCGSGTKTFDKNYKLFTSSMNNNLTPNIQNEDLFNKLRPIIKESINNVIDDRIIPKSFINAINKFKQEYIQTVQKIDDDFPMLDTSSGLESFYQVKDMEIKDGKWTYTLIYDDYNKTTYHESINLVVFDEDDKTFYFNGDYAKSYLSDLKKDLKKGIKYFKEYNPSFDDNEEQRNNFLNNL